jgi:uncharacterized protein with NRDE domain
MCLAALSIDQSRRYPLVIAINHDDFWSRPLSPLQWRTQGPTQTSILSGCHPETGHTWFGLNSLGRLALVTQAHSAQVRDPEAPSRGQIVLDWLTTPLSTDHFWMQTALSGYNGFHLIAADFRLGECFWGSNLSANTTRLEKGIYGLANAGLDTPWPKVVAIKAQLHALLAQEPEPNALSAKLFEAMARPQPPGLHTPSEHMRSAPFMHVAHSEYGTRCTTLVITERVKKRLITHVFERSVSPNDQADTALVNFTLKDWPPRYSLESSEPTLIRSGLHTSAKTAADSPAHKTRVRTLLRPDIELPKRLVSRGT